MKRTIVNILIALMIVVGYVMAKPMVLKKSMSSANFGIEQLVNKGKVKHLFIGSSMFRQSMQLDDVIKDDAYVLAYNGNQPYMIYKILDYLLMKKVEIENLYCDMYLYAIMQEPDIKDERIFLDTDMSLQFDILNEVRDYGKGGFNTYYDGLVSSNNEMLVTWPISYKLINSRYDRGASVPSNKKGKAAEELEEEKLELSTKVFNERQVYYIREIVKLARQNDINLLFIETPKYKAVTEKTNYPELMDDYAQLLKDSKIIMDERTYKKLNKKDSTIVTYNYNDDNPDFFSDVLHLSGEGRGVFSKDLHKILGIF